MHTIYVAGFEKLVVRLFFTVKVCKYSIIYLSALLQSDCSSGIRLNGPFVLGLQYSWFFQFHYDEAETSPCDTWLLNKANKDILA